MFVKITDPTMSVYDSGHLIGTARFTLSPDSEAALLDLVNYGVTPKSLIFLNVDFYQPTEYYNPPHQIEPVKRKGILRAVFTSDTKELSTIEIRFSFDAIPRGIRTGDRYYFDSIGYYNIQVESIDEVNY
ncbi:MAG: hypothetical protein H6Q60_1170 [Oscillospiraceae bacterium]|nr:hypothetical protein [Oscillospiraceae bacterium]